MPIVGQDLDIGGQFAAFLHALADLSFHGGQSLLQGDAAGLKFPGRFFLYLLANGLFGALIADCRGNFLAERVSIAEQDIGAGVLQCPMAKFRLIFRPGLEKQLAAAVFQAAYGLFVFR